LTSRTQGAIKRRQSALISAVPSPQSEIVPS
jgi:hypothetical protein